MTSSQPVYNSIGIGYRQKRIADPRIAAQIRTAIGSAQTVCNVGAGAGSYEPTDCEVTAVEPSQTMIEQRTSGARVVKATAENLPFEDNQFDVAMAVLTVHHWSDPRKGLAEMRRISQRQVVLTFDLDVACAFWVVKEYLPEIEGLDRGRTLTVSEITRELETHDVRNVLIPHDCRDGFQGAYWRRPEEYLKPDVRASISTFAQLPASTVESAMKRLEQDLQTGVWNRQNGDLLTKEVLDLGYRLVVAQS